MNPSSIADFAYYKLIYNYLTTKIYDFGMTLMHHFMTKLGGLALFLVTLWILIQGYRIVTGQSRESMTAFAVSAGRAAFVVSTALSMSVLGTNMYGFLTKQVPSEIGELFTGSQTSPADQIDKNLVWTQLAMAAIDTVQTAPDDQKSIGEKSRAQLLATFGTASPPMAAGAMLLMYQFALALFIGLGPLFILCLLFDQTKSMFQTWLLYGIGTMFSMALLSFISTLVLELTARIAAAYWSASTINALTGQGTEGFTSQALQQGGIGLLMTVLIISVPPMAAYFFKGTMGNFLFQSAFGFGGGHAAAMQQGLPPGAYGGGGYTGIRNSAGIGTHNQGPALGTDSGTPGVDPRFVRSATGQNSTSDLSHTPGTYGLAGKNLPYRDQN